MICPNCGKEVEEGSKFCSKCGYKIISQDKSIESANRDTNSIDNDNNKNVASNVSAKKHTKRKFPISPILIIVFAAFAYGAIYFVTKENPILILQNKFDEIKSSFDGNESNNNENFDAELKKQFDSSVLGDNVHIEGADVYQNPDGSIQIGDNVHVEGANVYQNPDGSIQIGGTPNDGAKLVQGGETVNDENNELEYDYSNISNELSSQIRNVKVVTEHSNDITIEEVDSVTFGLDKNSEPLEWIVLEKSNNKALLLSKYLLTSHSYNDEYVDITWENCTMRKWLNSEYINTIFSKKEQGSILTTDVINNDNVFGTKGGNNTKDKLFLLSIDEVNKYFNNDNQRVATYKGGSSDFWWLRSPGPWQYNAANVYDHGNLTEYGYNVDNACGVRPALWVSYNRIGNSIGNNDENGSKNIKESKNNETTSFSFDQKLIDEYNNEENKGKCKFDSDGNLWIESWPYLGSGPGEGVTIKYANGNVEHYEYSGAASAYDGGGHIDIYATEINGVIKSIEVRDENIKDSDKEFVNKIYEMIERFKSLEDEYK